MKKIFIPIIAIASLSLASCQKERTCTCNTTQTVNGVGEASTSAVMVGHATKKEAKRMTDCYSANSKRTETIMGTIYNIEVKRECELK